MPNLQLLTAAELAHYTGLSRQRIYALARLGLLPSIRLGRSVRFSADAVERWLAAGGASVAAPHQASSPEAA